MEIIEEGSSIILNPTPGFVIKTKILESKDYSTYLLSTKVFINICHDKQVPKPNKDFDPAVVFPLIINNEWEIPLIVSKEKKDKDKKGQASFVYDCCINTICFQWCQINSDLRSILIEWCVESIELLYDLTLEREYSIPKMMSKGNLSQTIVEKNEIDESGFQKKLQNLKDNETLGLIEEMRDNNLNEENTELPNLMNIKGNPGRDGAKASSKPLIEEITEMKITDLHQTKAREILPEPREIGPQKYDFTLSFQKLTSKHQLSIKLESAQFTQNFFHVEFFPSTHSLILKNLNNDYYFTKNQPEKLEIHLPESVSIIDGMNINAFYVKNQQSIYVFI